MRVLLKGYYGFGNLGDDILLKTTWGIVKDRYKTATISVYSNFNENLNGFDRQNSYNEYIFKIIGDTPELIDWTIAGSFDLLVDGGGGVYFDYQNGSFFYWLLNKICRFFGASRLHYLNIFLRKCLGKKEKKQFKRRIALGLGIGPYSSRSPLLFRHLADIGSTNEMFVRDETSMQWLQLLNYRGKKHLYTDIAFLDTYWLPEGIYNISKQFNGNLGIILLDWHEGNADRFNEFKEFANWAKKSGHSVTFFSFDENNDKEYINEFRSLYNTVVWNPHTSSLTDFLALLADQGIVLSARAHGIIISSILGVPTLSIGTSKKLIEVSKMFPNSSPLISEPISCEDLKLHFKLTVDNYEERLKALKGDVEHNKKIATNMLKEVNATL
jgi:polysaccharide pyruvyl transferase WcaK-like protein